MKTWPVLLQQNLQLLSNDEKNIVRDLLVLGQQHLFATWDPPGTNDDLKHSFFEQIKELNRTYVGGVSSYVRNARKLLTAAKKGENPFEGWKPEVPSGIKLEPVTEQYVQFEQIGIPLLGKMGFVLVAGGLGERLGYHGIKVELPSQTVTGTCYLELYCQQILYMQKRYAAPGFLLPLAIMVSDDTIHRTESLLEENNYFGLEKGQVTLLKQGKVPALLSNSAHIALATSYSVVAKPHGHGDVHSLLHSSGTARKWKNAGIKYIMFFQDTNGLGFYTLPAMLGVSEVMELEVNSLAVNRHAKQSVGAITRLIQKDGREMTINVEYNQLDPLLRATVNPEGDQNDPHTGFSPYPGNINQLLFLLEPYVKMLNKTEGVMPEFVNPKYTDSSRNMFKSPTRLECMMQDYPKLLSSEAKVGFTVLPDWICYSPCKNNLKDAAASVANGVPAACCFTAESAQYFVFAELLRRMGANVEPAEEMTISGIAATPSPRIVFQPSFAIFAHEIAERFPRPDRVNLSSRSTLVLEGDVVVEYLELDGSAKISATPDARVIVRAHSSYYGDSIKNEGHELKVINSGDSKDGKFKIIDQGYHITEIDEMRGYVIQCNDICSVCTIPESSTTNGFHENGHNDNGRLEGSESLQVYVFDGCKLVGDVGSYAEPVVADDEPVDCCCCDFYSCLVPEFQRQAAVVDLPPLESETDPCCSCLVPEWGPTVDEPCCTCFVPEFSEN